MGGANLDKVHLILLLLHITLKGWKRGGKEWRCWALLVLFPWQVQPWLGSVRCLLAFGSFLQNCPCKVEERRCAAGFGGEGITSVLPDLP